MNIAVTGFSGTGKTTVITQKIAWLIEQNLARADEISIPLLLLAAGDDRIVSAKISRRFFNNASSEKKEVHIFDGFYHELIHERDRQKPIKYLRDFLINRIA